MKLVCIDNKRYITNLLINGLTIGKTYNLIKGEFNDADKDNAIEDTIIIIDDDGDKRLLSSSLFISLERYRENKLNSLDI